MNFSREELLALAALPDEELWCKVKEIAAAFGISLPRETPSHAELEKLRQIATGGKISMPEAMYLINKYKRGQK